MPLVSFYDLPKTSENQRFSGVFRGYRKKPLACNGLMIGKNIDISDKIMRKISTQISVTFLVISLTGFYQYEL